MKKAHVDLYEDERMKLQSDIQDVFVRVTRFDKKSRGRKISIYNDMLPHVEQFIRLIKMRTGLMYGGVLPMVAELGISELRSEHVCRKDWSVSWTGEINGRAWISYNSDCSDKLIPAEDHYILLCGFEFERGRGDNIPIEEYKIGIERGQGTVHRMTPNVADLIDPIHRLHVPHFMCRERGTDGGRYIRLRVNENIHKYKRGGFRPIGLCVSMGHKLYRE